ncbi:MAG: hypothetical protein IJQ86_03555 [Spirochaetia bacterium]|nr:hypothetical protein [Spirochaetia bacterium]
MKLKHLFLILLALCIVFFLTGCDSGGGSSSSGGGGGGGGDDSGTMIFKVTDLVNRAAVTGFTSNSGTIHYVDNESKTHDDTVTLTVNLDDNTFSLYQKEVCSDPLYSCDLTYSGTFAKEGNTVNVHCTLTKYTNGDPDNTTPWDDSFTITSETTVNVWGWVMTKQ